MVGVGLAPFSFAGHWLKFETDQKVPPLCAVLSEQSMQLVCFPFADDWGDHAIDCLVLPPIPLFLKVNVADSTNVEFVAVNRYLLALILLWTKQNAFFRYLNIATFLVPVDQFFNFLELWNLQRLGMRVCGFHSPCSFYSFLQVEVSQTLQRNIATMK